MTRLTLAVAGRTLFGLDLSEQSERASRGFDTALAAIGRRGPANLQVPLWVPTPGNLRFRRALRELDTIVYDIIRRFHAGQAENADQTLLGAYMAARDPESGEGMSDRQLRDEVVTLYLAGHETTASLLTWALYWLARRPDIAKRVTAEIDRLIVNDNRPVHPGGHQRPPSVCLFPVQPGSSHLHRYAILLTRGPACARVDPAAIQREAA
jgi:cytochrome P450